jgi:hypothetical protein
VAQKPKKVQVMINKIYNLPERNTSGLYYKHVTIVNDDSRVISNWSIKLIDDLSVITYDRQRFIIQATDGILNLILNENTSAVSFCCQVGTWVPDMFCNFYFSEKWQNCLWLNNDWRKWKNKRRFGILRKIRIFLL